MENMGTDGEFPVSTFGYVHSIENTIQTAIPFVSLPLVTCQDARRSVALIDEASLVPGNTRIPTFRADDRCACTDESPPAHFPFPQHSDTHASFATTSAFPQLHFQPPIEDQNVRRMRAEIILGGATAVPENRLTKLMTFRRSMMFVATS
jgi:hypothetical protein